MQVVDANAEPVTLGPLSAGARSPVDTTTPPHGSLAPSARQPRKPLNPKTAFIIAWHKQVARDGDLPKGSLRLALILSHELWPHTEIEGAYNARKSQAWLARETDMSRKTVQEAASALVQRGHMRIVSRKGQGVENLYEPISKEVDEQVKRPKVVVPVLASDDQIKGLTMRYASDIAAIRADFERVTVLRLPELSEIFLAAFPGPQDQADMDLATTDFLMFIFYGEEPVDLIREARASVAAAVAADEPSPGPMSWTTSKSKQRRQSELDEILRPV